MLYEVKLVRTVVEERILVVEGNNPQAARKRACRLARQITKPRKDEDDGDWEPRFTMKNHVLSIQPTMIDAEFEE